MNDLGVAYLRQGRLAKAFEIHIAALAGSQSVLGPKHPQVLTLLSNLADDYSKQQRWKDAVECQDNAVEGMRHTYGVDHKFTTKGLQRLEEFRNSMNSATSESHSLYLQDDKSADVPVSPSSPAKPTIQQIVAVTRANDVLNQELIQNMPTVPEDEPESRVGVLDS